MLAACAWLPAAGPVLQEVPGPKPPLNSWAARSTSSPLAGLAKPTVTVEGPGLVMVPSHSSMSWVPSLDPIKWVQVPTFPPEIDKTETMEDETFTTITRASPTF